MVKWARYGSERAPPICAPPNEAIAVQVRCDWHPGRLRTTKTFWTAAAIVSGSLPSTTPPRTSAGGRWCSRSPPTAQHGWDGEEVDRHATAHESVKYDGSMWVCVWVCARAYAASRVRCECGCALWVHVPGTGLFEKKSNVRALGWLSWNWYCELDDVQDGHKLQMLVQAKEKEKDESDEQEESEEDEEKWKVKCRRNII